MKFVKCRVCKREVLETVRQCPYCESQGPKRARRIHIVMIVLVILLAVAMGAIIYNRKQEKVRTRAEIDEARRAERIHQRIMSATFLLRTSTADPASVQVDDIRTNLDGSVLCYWYSVKDNRGKAQKKKAVFAEGDFHHSAGSWGIYCTGKELMEVPDKPPPP